MGVSSLMTFPLRLWPSKSSRCACLPRNRAVGTGVGALPARSGGQSSSPSECAGRWSFIIQVQVSESHTSFGWRFFGGEGLREDFCDAVAEAAAFAVGIVCFYKYLRVLVVVLSGVVVLWHCVPGTLRLSVFPEFMLSAAATATAFFTHGMSWGVRTLTERGGGAHHLEKLVRQNGASTVG